MSTSTTSPGKVSFIILGAMKAATTAMSAHLDRHPDICMCTPKEPHFFALTPDWKSHVDEYHAMFDAKEGTVWGEASTSYTFYPEYLDVPQRIHAYNPGMKLIYCFRDPVERIESDFNHRFVRGYIGNDYKTILFADPSFINRTRYALQLKQFTDVFGREKLHTLKFDEYIRDEQGHMNKILDFLALPRMQLGTLNAQERLKTTGVAYTPAKVKRVTGVLSRPPFAPFYRVAKALFPRKAKDRFLTRTIKEKVRFDPETKQHIWRMVETDMEIIEREYGMDFSSWRKKYE